MFVLKVNKSVIRVLESETIYGDSKNIYNVVLLFNEDWAGLTKVITFDNEKKSYPIIADATRTIVTTSIPWELLTYPGSIRVSVSGARNNLVVLPTQFCVLGKIHKGNTVEYPPDVGDPPPTPTFADQMLGLLAQKADTIDYIDGVLYLKSGDTILSQTEIQNGSNAVTSVGNETISDSSFFGEDSVNQTYILKDTTIQYIDNDGNEASMVFPDDVVQIVTDENGMTIYKIDGTVAKFLTSEDGSFTLDSVTNTADTGSVSGLNNETISDKSFFGENPVNQTYALKNVTVEYINKENEPAAMVFEDDVVQVVSDEESLSFYKIDGKTIKFLYSEDGTLRLGSVGYPSTDGDGKSAYDIAVENGFEGTEEEWLQSLDGESAYDLAVKDGFEGTLSEWLESLHGTDGLNAYDIAVQNGFIGTEEDWLKSLDGKSAYDIAVENGFEGTEEEWIQSLDGQSAYQLAVDNGFEGTEDEWLDSLKGKPGAKGNKGDPGKSAYEIAVDNGFEGTAEEWLKSLDGKSAYDIAVENGFEGTAEEWLESIEAQPITNEEIDEILK